MRIQVSILGEQRTAPKKRRWFPLSSGGLPIPSTSKGPDLFVGQSTQNVATILPGNSNGNFAAAINYNGVTNPQTLAIGDFNSDGNADVAIANASTSSIVNTNTVSVLTGNSNGVFTSQANINLPAHYGAFFTQVADLNGDGKPDIAAVGYNVSSPYGQLLCIMLGNGNGTFQSPLTFALPTGLGGTLSQPDGLVIADLNGDGIPDIVTASRNIAGGTVGVSVLLGNGNGTFQAAVNTTFASGNQITTLVDADFNGDGIVDLAAFVNAGTPHIYILLGNGNGTFQTPFSLATARANTNCMAAGDINGDGNPDLVIAGTTFVGVNLGNGNGTFKTQTTFAAGYDPNDIILPDINGDGKADIVMSYNKSGPISGVSVLLGNGNGTFQAATNTIIPSSTKCLDVTAWVPTSGFSFVQSGVTHSTAITSSITFQQASNPGLGDLIVVDAGCSAGVAPTFNTPTDTIGNTYKKIRSVPSYFNTANLTQFYAVNKAAGTVNTVTVTPTSGCTMSLGVTEYSNALPILQDAIGPALGSWFNAEVFSGSVTSFAMMGPIMTCPMELVHASAICLNPGTFTGPTAQGFTEAINSTGTNGVSMEVAYQLSAASTPYPQWATTNSITEWLCIASAFRGAYVVPSSSSNYFQIRIDAFNNGPYLFANPIGGA
jgi:hypothetical protein